MSTSLYSKVFLIAFLAISIYVLFVVFQAGPKPGEGALALSDSPDVTPPGKGYDPAGFTAVDVLASASLGHAIGVGMVLGLKAINVIS